MGKGANEIDPAGRYSGPDTRESQALEGVTWQPGEMTNSEVMGHAPAMDVMDVPSGAGYAPEADEVSATRARIEETRAHMSETVDAIQEKLSPSNMVQGATSAVRDATIGRAQAAVSSASDTAAGLGSSILDTVRQNPVPTALVGFGLGWLYFSHRQQPGQRIRQSAAQFQTNAAGRLQDTTAQAQQAVSNAAGQVQGTISDTASQVQDTLSQTAGQIQDTAAQLADQVQGQVSQLGAQTQYQAQRAQYGFQQMMQEQPLAVGAAAVALGIVAGLAIPETPQEHALMGSAKDSVVEQVQGQVQDAAQRIQSVAQEAIGAAANAAREEAANQGLGE
jgi:gas vesicle protein